MRSIQWIGLGLCFAALAACGGGGSGGGGASVDVSPENLSSSNNANARPVVVGSATPTRTQAGQCQVDQVIASPRNDNARIASLRYLQVVEQDASNSSATLVSNKSLRLRVDLLANAGTLAPTRANVAVFNPSTRLCQTFRLEGPNRLPTQVDSTRLDDAFTVDLPASIVQPGMSMSVFFDDNQGRSSAEAARLVRTVVPAMLTGVAETVRVIPLRYEGQTGFATSASVKSIIERTSGISTINVLTANAISPRAFNSSGGGFLGLFGSSASFNATTLERTLAEVDDECARLNGPQSSARSSPKCLGVFPDNVRFTSGGLSGSGEIVGVAYVGGTTMMTQSLGGSDINVTSPYADSHWLAFRAVTVAHEYGHLLNLNHAACGVSGRTDSRLYRDGRIGSTGAGFDAGRGFYFSATQRNASGALQFGDLMSYCEKEWPSDLGYIASASYRAGGASSREAAAREVPSKRWLKITGFDNQWQLKAVYTAPASLQETPMRLLMSASDGQHELMLQRPQISDLALASALGPYYVELPTSAVESLSGISWQLLNSAGQLISSGIGELLNSR